MTDESPKHYPTIPQSIGLSLRFLLYSIALGLLAVFLDYLLKNQFKATHALTFLLGYVAAIMLTIWAGFYKFQKKEHVRLRLKFNKPPVAPLVVSIVMILAVSFIVDPFTLFFPPTGYWKKLFDEMGDGSVFTMIMSVIAAPILEEIFFRGIILNGLLKNYSPRTAILVSAALFGLIHLNMWQALPAFLGGLVIGYMYWKTNSIIPGMILHFTNNLFCVLLSIRFNEMNWLITLVGAKMYVAVVIFSVIVFVAGAFYLNGFFEARPPFNLDEMEPVGVEDETPVVIGVVTP